MCVFVCSCLYTRVRPFGAMLFHPVIWARFASFSRTGLAEEHPPTPALPQGGKQPHIAFIMKGLSCKKGLKKMKDSLLSQSSDL